jgi:hypothetical protein
MNIITQTLHLKEWYLFYFYFFKKLLKALTSQLMESDEKLPKTFITKIGGNIIYEFLKAPNIVFFFLKSQTCNLDYFIIIDSLCQILIMVYRKFLDIDAETMEYEAISKIDEKINVIFF